MTVYWPYIFSLLLILVALWPASTTAAPSEAEQIAFVAFRNGAWDVYSISPDGTNLRQLTADPYADDDPAYSPDGTKLVYTSRRNNNWDLYLLDLVTGTETQLTNHPQYDGTPAWHPGGEQIAFESHRADDLDIWLLNLGSDAPPINLTGDSTAGESDPVWHSDGERLFFASWRADTNDLWSLEVASGALTQLTAAPTAEIQPVWNPVQQQLAFTRNTLGDTDFFTLAADGSLRQVSWLGSLQHALYGPDGTTLVGVYRDYRGAQLIRLEADNPIPKALTSPAILRPGISWHGQAVTAGNAIDSLRSTDNSLLYIETMTPSSSPHGEPYDLLRVNDLQVGSPWFADTVDESFRALRQHLHDEVGYDFLGELSDAHRVINFNSDTSQYSSWHKSGRAFDTRFDLPGGRLQIVRENLSGETYWRILLKCIDQTGGCGRPTTANPWNYSGRARNVIAPEQGGIERPNIFGYYVDFTEMAELFGWERIASFDDEDFSWTWHFKAFEYWHYQKLRNGQGMPIEWYEAMLEVYPPAEVAEYFTWERMRAADEDPLLIGIKGAPLPPQAERWWQAARP